MIDNVVLPITGTLHERDTHELLERCHPLGVFDTLPTLCVATDIEELYHTALVETPLGIFTRTIHPSSDSYPGLCSSRTHAPRPSLLSGLDGKDTIPIRMTSPRSLIDIPHLATGPLSPSRWHPQFPRPISLNRQIRTCPTAIQPLRMRTAR